MERGLTGIPADSEMDKDKTAKHAGDLPPLSGRHTNFSLPGSSYYPNHVPLASSSFHQRVAPGASSDFGQDFSHEISGMPDYPLQNLGHRRAHSEILNLPDYLGFNSGLGGVGGAEPLSSDETDEDLLSMFLDMDMVNSTCVTTGIQIGESSGAVTGKLSAVGAGTSSMEAFAGGSSERPRVRHEHSQSMDGSMTMKPEMLISGSEEPAAFEMRKFLSAEKLAELALIDPKRARRIWANRQSAARSKERKMRHIAELERKFHILQTEATKLSTQLNLLQKDTNGLTSETSELKLRVETMEQQVHFQDELNDALKDEIQHLKLLTGQAMANFASYGAGQQFHPNNNAMHALLTAQQFQQLQLHPQRQQHQLQRHQVHQLQQQQRAGNLKGKRSIPPPGQRKDKASDGDSPAKKY